MAENPTQEIEFSVAGATFKVRPTFAILGAIEATLDQPCRQLGMKCLALGTSAAARGEIKEISLIELAAIVWVIVKGQKGAPESQADVGEALVDDGYQDLALPIGQFLTRAQRGNKEHEKQAMREAEEAARAAQDPQTAAAPEG